MLLIGENREPQPPAGLPVQRRTWPITALRLSWRLAAGLALLLVSSAFPPVEAYALIIAACVLIARGLAVVVLSLPDLTDHRG
jgi:hypothetical protein